jgi:hypothetical protein
MDGVPRAPFQFLSILFSRRRRALRGPRMMLKATVRRAFFAIVPLLLGGACAQTQMTNAEVQFYMSPTQTAAPQRILGLREKFDRLSTTDKKLRVLVVNGMSTDAHGYSYDTQQDFARMLGQGNCVADRVVALDRPAFSLGPSRRDVEEFSPATLRITSWASDAKGTSRIVFYELLWTPYADEVTDRYIAKFETDIRLAPNPAWRACAGEQAPPPRDERRDPGRTRPQRAMLNALVTEDVVLAGFTDVIMSLGPLGGAARDAIRQAFCAMAADALEVPPTKPDETRCRLRPETLDRFGGAEHIATQLNANEFAVLTYSLGSFLLIDAIDEFRLRPDDLGFPELICPLMSALLDDMPVYMFSNQVSLLMTAHPYFGCDPATTCAFYGWIGGRRILLSEPRDRTLRTEDPVVSLKDEGACKVPLRMQLVAFVDPNDVLGYRLPDYLAKAPLFSSIVNVSVENPAFWIPGLFVNPVAAHTNYGANPAVLQVVIEGWPH